MAQRIGMGGILLHSSTKVSTFGDLVRSRLAAASTWACASASSSSVRSCSSVRCSALTGVMPSTGVAGSAPTACRCAVVSERVRLLQS